MSKEYKLTKRLDRKYAKMWNQTCGWDIPRSIKPWHRDGELTFREKELYVEAAWKVLNIMASDGLITRDSLRYWHDKENGWPSGKSTISEGWKP